MNNIEHLKQIHESFKNDEKVIFEKIKDLNNITTFVPSLEGANIVNALYIIYIEQDFQEAKASFYKAARVALYMSDTYDRRVMDSGIYQMSYALLSDNSSIIKRYSTLINKVNHITGIGYQIPNSVQNILLEDWDKVDWNIHCLTKLVKIKQFVWCAGFVDTVKGFKEKDEQLIKKGLDELLATHKKRNRDPLFSKFFSIDTAGFNKLAWLKGYRIDLGSPLVPAQLMPVEPLEHYEDYDFLK